MQKLVLSSFFLHNQQHVSHQIISAQHAPNLPAENLQNALSLIMLRIASVMKDTRETLGIFATR
jgi:hypothetical protein